MCRKKVLTIYSMNLLTMTELERHFTIQYNVGKQMHVMMCFNMDQNVTVQTQEVDLPGV